MFMRADDMSDEKIIGFREIDGLEYNIRKFADGTITFERAGLYFIYDNHYSGEFSLYGVDKEKCGNGETIILPRACHAICTHALSDIGLQVRRIIGKNVKILRKSALENMSNLEEVYFDRLKEIGDHAFRGCWNFKFKSFYRH